MSAFRINIEFQGLTPFIFSNSRGMRMDFVLDPFAILAFGAHEIVVALEAEPTLPHLGSSTLGRGQFVGSSQQLLNHRRIEFPDHIRIREQPLGELRFFLLESMDPLLDGFLAEEFVDKQRLVLTVPVGTTSVPSTFAGEMLQCDS